MKGDFSKWSFDPKKNFNGVLHQQGRVLLDSDWNARTRITNDWQDQAGRDAIGPGVAAVPASEPDSFKVQRALLDASNEVELTITPGRLWADGLLLCLPGEAPDPTADVRRIATYLQPPIQDPPADPIGPDIRDAVILEIWREAINGFQMPETLIEPALGGPDTTERVHTAMAFRLLRLEDGDTCDNIGDKLKDGFSQKGKLTVSLQPTTVIDGDCPVVEGGGYTGFEHHLYRIEIAQVNSGAAMFKWSQFNGGLVGRGIFHADSNKVEITANLQAIVTSGLNEFYLEAVESDQDLGHWNVTYGAKVTLNSGNELDLPAAPMFGSIPASGESVFFRLWNDIREIGEFSIGPDPTELRDGIRLEFALPIEAHYMPGDYWTFPVRAGEIGNPEVLIDEEPPEGIHYHRVPLAILNWDSDQDISFETEEIEDCRDIFRPLTNQTVCCSFTVGDGESGHGDFDSIEEAVRHLPSSGGEICLLPGLHEADVCIEGKYNIKIKGCDKKTKIIPREADREASIFHVIDSQCIILEDMDMVTLGGTAIVLEGTELGALQQVEIRNNRMLAYANAISVKRGVGIHIHHNKISMLDKEGADVAIHIMAEDSVIERNDIGVVPAESIPPVDIPGDETPDPIDPCADPERVYINIPFFVAYVNWIWGFTITLPPPAPFKALGGIQIVGGSERIKVLENEINGGAGNGITLGGALLPGPSDSDERAEETEHVIEHTGGSLWGRVVFEGTGLGGVALLFEESDGATLTATTDNTGFFLIAAAPGDYNVSITTPGYKIESITTEGSGEFVRFRIDVGEEEIDLGDLLAFIYEIQIDRNEISNMGLSGIGVPHVTPPDPSAVPTTALAMTPILALLGNPVINLNIHRNHIFNCLQHPFDEEMRTRVRETGLGGISLGMCEDLSIRGNRIENNGANHINPVCGVYLTYGEHVDITLNHIVDNGPLVESINADLESGIRGGVVLRIVSSLSIFDLITGARDTVAKGRPAARVHDNVVDQPAGQALSIISLGPVSILNSQFNSELSGPEALERLAGAVLIFNLGGLATAGVGSDVTTGTTETHFAAAPSATFSRRSRITLRLPNGNTLFNSNQTRLGFGSSSIASQLIGSMDDVGFDGNQSDALGGGIVDVGGFVMNTLLSGATLRASDNRFKEVIDPETPLKISLFTTSSLMNNTTNNQGNHCIIAVNTDPARPAVDPGNQVLNEVPCGQLSENLLNLLG
ncbi:MAG: DUF6519 domain-containing protein [Candidatus Bipolaricaulia bacterium]